MWKLVQAPLLSDNRSVVLLEGLHIAQLLISRLNSSLGHMSDPLIP